MFNGYLKSRVDALCGDLSALVANQPGLIQTGSFQSQNQGGYNQQHQQTGGGPGFAPGSGPNSLFIPPPNTGASGNWWGEELSWPNSTGSQNNVRYAYFAQAQRLAIDVNGTVTIYDTLDNAIGGFGQQQSYGGSFTFSSQYGTVDVASLPVVSVNGVPAGRPAAPSQFEPNVAPRDAPGAGTDVFGAIEKLAALNSRGILSDAEFATKKAELLSRL
jgi:hypothetical protein